MELCIELAKRASSERQKLKEDCNGTAILSQSLFKTLSMAGEGYKKLNKDYPFFGGGKPGKTGCAVPLVSPYTGISGMYFPFTIEAN